MGKHVWTILPKIPIHIYVNNNKSSILAGVCFTIKREIVVQITHIHKNSIWNLIIQTTRLLKSRKLMHLMESLSSMRTTTKRRRTMQDHAVQMRVF
jgi:hypothetical protein